LRATPLKNSHTKVLDLTVQLLEEEESDIQSLVANFTVIFYTSNVTKKAVSFYEKSSIELITILEI
jgi:hypothetical protein